MSVPSSEAAAKSAAVVDVDAVAGWLGSYGGEEGLVKPQHR
jgi:hypothetical protein